MRFLIQPEQYFPSLKSGSHTKALVLDASRLAALWDFPREADAQTWANILAASGDEDDVPRLDSGLPDLSSDEASPFVATYCLHQAGVEYWRGSELLADLLQLVSPPVAYTVLWTKLGLLLASEPVGKPWWLAGYLCGSNFFGLLAPAELVSLQTQLEQDGPGLLAGLTAEGHFTADLAELFELIHTAAEQEQWLLVVDGQ